VRAVFANCLNDLADIVTEHRSAARMALSAAVPPPAATGR